MMSRGQAATLILLVAALATLHDGTALLAQSAPTPGDASRLEALAGLWAQERLADANATALDGDVDAKRQFRYAVVAANEPILAQQDPLRSDPLSQLLANEALGVTRAPGTPTDQAVNAAFGDYTIPQQRAHAAIASADQVVADAEQQAQDAHKQTTAVESLASEEASHLSLAHLREARWAERLLDALAAPVTGSNLRAVVAWQQAESTDPACHNPLATTLVLAGSTALNAVGVQCYRDDDTGLAATLSTIRLPAYAGIVFALEAGADAPAVSAAVAQSPWGTGRNAVVALGQL